MAKSTARIAAGAAPQKWRPIRVVRTNYAPECSGRAETRLATRAGCPSESKTGPSKDGPVRLTPSRGRRIGRTDTQFRAVPAASSGKSYSERRLVPLFYALFSHVLYQLSYLAGVAPKGKRINTLRRRFSRAVGLGHAIGTSHP